MGAGALAERSVVGSFDFDSIYDAGLKRTGTRERLQRRVRFRSLVEIFRSTEDVAGSVAECGVFRGLSSWCLLNALRDQGGGKYRIFDSFEGLSDPQPQDGEPSINLWRGNFSIPLSFVEYVLHEFNPVEYFQGWIPRSFPDDEERYRFVHVDVDLYQPTRDSIDYFWPRLNEGGAVVCDDYNWPGGKKAVDEMCEKYGISLQFRGEAQAVMRK